MLTRAREFPITSLEVMLIADRASVGDNYAHPDAADTSEINEIGYRVLRTDCRIVCYGETYNAVIKAGEGRYFLASIESSGPYHAKLPWRKFIQYAFYALLVVLVLWWVNSGRQEKKASESYQSAVNILNEAEQGLKMARDFQVDRGQLNLAVKQLDRSINLNPKDPNAHYYLGRVHTLLRNWDDALMAYEAVIRLKPDHVEAYQGMGSIYRKITLPNKAVDAYREWVRLKPDDHLAYRALGHAYSEDRRWDEAARSYAKCAEINSSEGPCYTGAGKAYYMAGRNQDAIKAFEKAITIFNKDVEANYYLGLAYLKSGNRDMAEVQVEVLKAIDADTHNPETKEYAEKLARSIQAQGHR